MFDSVLVANRGEIAVRIIRTLRRLGIRSIAVYSDADADAPHVWQADLAVHIGPAVAINSYLAIDRVIAAATETGAQAIHPGYGFLSENASFAHACDQAGLVFVGPPPQVIEAMGDKIRAKQLAEAAGVPVIPGCHTHGLSDKDIIRAAPSVGYPLLLKPSAGGGGKGMRLVHNAADLPEEIQAARREARAAFGDDTLFVERYIEAARHIEVQILADQHGNVVHLGERECSLQRRHQKIIEESPSPALTPTARDELGELAVSLAQACGYVGAGTVECVMAGKQAGEGHPDFYFMEMNTRLQVEHPVTELIYGVDLVEWQVRIAAGEALPWRQQDIHSRGHALEARVYAEDPARDFLPTPGPVLFLHEPVRPHVRIDSGLATGFEVSGHYDPMLAKVIAWGEDRPTALRRLDAALADTVVLGLQTNISFLRKLLADTDVLAGQLDTGLIARHKSPLFTREPSADVFIAAALAQLLEREAAAEESLWAKPNGWRMTGAAWQSFRIRIDDGASVEVRIRGETSSADICVDHARPVHVSAWARGPELCIRCDGQTYRYWHIRTDGAIWLARQGESWAAFDEERSEISHAADFESSDGILRSPMPGAVVAVNVTAGESVGVGQPLVIVEAMKMEHVIAAPIVGEVADIHVQGGESVAQGQPLVTLFPEVGHAGSGAAGDSVSIGDK